MAFFSRKQKQLALKTNSKTIKEKYEQTELHLRQCAKNGNERELKKAMAEHRNIEYALLYKNTPEYRDKVYKRKK